MQFTYGFQVINKNNNKEMFPIKSIWLIIIIIIRNSDHPLNRFNSYYEHYVVFQ